MKSRLILRQNWRPLDFIHEVRWVWSRNSHDQKVRVNGKNKGEKRARKRKGRKMAIRVSNLNAVKFNSKCFFPTKTLVEGNNLKVTVYPIITNYRNYNNQPVTSKEFCYWLQITLLRSKQLCAVGKLIMENLNQFPLRIILLMMEKALLGKVFSNYVQYHESWQGGLYSFSLELI